MKNLNDKLSEALDIEPLIVDNSFQQEVLPIEVLPKEVTTTNNVVEDDAEFARRNLKSLIEKGNTAVEGILNVAAATDHPRAFEVAATMLKTMADMNKDLLEIQKRKRDLQPQVTNQTVNVDKAVFVGSTAELLKQLKENK
jgi:hypothetical protein